MAELKYRQEKIKEKRKNSQFRDFIREIVSWYPLILNKNKGIVSRYPETSRIKGIVNYSDFDNNRDSLLKNGLIYDLEQDFFKNYQKLFKSIDLPSVINYSGNENAGFSDSVMNSKNIYLSTAIIQNCENILYSFNVKENSNNILNSVNVIDSCDNVYLSSGVIKGFNIFYSRYIYNSNNIWFSRNLIGCSECIFCDNIENKSFCINNIELKKEDYLLKKQQILSKKTDFLSWYKNSFIIGINVGSHDVKGDFIFYSENIENGYFAYQVKNGRNLIFWGGTQLNENIYDVFGGGSLSNNDIYGVTGAGANSSNLYCCAHIASSSNLFYSYFLENCSYCIGCIGLKNKSFCILNKQYEKKEWYVLADKIFEQMEKDQILGDFFPGELNPFYFNDSMAYITDDTFTREEVEQKGYMRREENIKIDISDLSEIIEIKDLKNYEGYDEDGHWKINKEILNKVIVDKTGNYYKIIPIEYNFLLKYELPLPEIHWLHRIKLGFKFK